MSEYLNPEQLLAEAGTLGKKIKQMVTESSKLQNPKHPKQQSQKTNTEQDKGK